MNGYENLITYLLNYVNDAENKPQLAEYKKQLEKCVKKIELINSMFANNFCDYNSLDVKPENIKKYKAFIEDLISIGGKKYEFTEVLELLISYNGDRPDWPQTKRTQEIFKDLKKLYDQERLALRYKVRELEGNDIYSPIIKRVVKKEKGKYVLSGNISKEDFNKLVQFLKIQRELEYSEIIAFVEDLSGAIASNRKDKEEFEAKKAQVINYEKFESIIGSVKEEEKIEKVDTNKISRSTLAPYEYDKILAAIAGISTRYEETTTNTQVIDDAPFDRNRFRKYSNYDAEAEAFIIDFGLILYDFNNYLYPENIERLYYGGKISSKQVNDIRNVIYPNIISKYNILLNQEEEAKKKQEESKKTLTIEHHAETSKEETEVKVSVTPEEVIEIEKETKEEIKLEPVRKFIFTFEPLDENVLNNCNLAYLKAKDIVNYNDRSFDAYASNPKFPNLMSIADNYIAYYDTYLESLKANGKMMDNFDEDKALKGVREEEELLLETFEELSNAFEEIFDVDILVYGEDEEIDDEIDEEDILSDYEQNTRKNIILFAPDYLEMDIRDAKRLLNSRIGVFDLCNRLDKYPINSGIKYEGRRKLDYIEGKGCSNAVLKHFVRKYRPMRFGPNKNVRFCFVTVSLSKKNCEELLEAYGDKIAIDGSPDFKLLFCFDMFDVNSNENISYIQACNRGFGFDSKIQEYNELFGKDFTNETREKAYNLINASLAFEKQLKDGETRVPGRN